MASQIIGTYITDHDLMAVQYKSTDSAERRAYEICFANGEIKVMYLYSVADAKVYARELSTRFMNNEPIISVRWNRSA